MLLIKLLPFLSIPPQLSGCLGAQYVCQEAACGRREEGIRSIELHMEATHPNIGAT